MSALKGREVLAESIPDPYISCSVGVELDKPEAMEYVSRTFSPNRISGAIPQPRDILSFRSAFCRRLRTSRRLRPHTTFAVEVST